MKIYAYYLPQFHEIPENNEWHGQGFTEWTNVKKSKPLYKGHMQPRHPMDGNYYNLLDETIVKNQVETAKQYGIDGFVYYHYWFNGKMLMEKPAENFLKWKDMQHEFFFCWANHSFYKRWDGSNRLLLEQTYGQKEDWKTHFDYLLPFFKDARYVKINNKPVFMIYRGAFDEKAEMVEYFDQLCKENGFDGIYYMEVCPNEAAFEAALKNSNETVPFPHMPNMAASIFDRQHKRTRFFRKCEKKASQYLHLNTRRRYVWYEGDELLKQYNQSRYLKDARWAGLFFAWDNTPRYGVHGYEISHISKQQLFTYLDTVKDKEAVIINAWNEWAEGMILEPSEEREYQDLEWLREWRNSRKS